MKIFVVSWVDALGQEITEVHRRKDRADERIKILEGDAFNQAGSQQIPQLDSYNLPDTFEDLVHFLSRLLSKTPVLP